MIGIPARGCPPGTALSQCPGMPGYSQACSPVTAPPATFSPDMHVACYHWAAQLASPSWWTPLHIVGVTAIIVGLVLAVAALRDCRRARDLLRGALR